MEATTRFPDLIRGLSCRDGVAALVAGLGLAPDLAVIPPSAFAAHGIDLPCVRAACRLFERGVARGILVELDGDVTARIVSDLAVRVARAGVVLQALLFVAAADWSAVAVAGPAMDGVPRHLTLERASVRVSDADALREMVARPGEAGLGLALRWGRALDRSRVTSRFFVDFRAQRARVSGAWLDVPVSARADRDQLALLFLCRMMFLYFLQRNGHLAGDDSFLVRLFRSHGSRRRTSFFRGPLDSLFFGALNTRPESRTPAARRLGELPYLNGGLFERTALERGYPGHDLADAVIAGVFDNLLEKYRFTSADRADDAAGAGMAAAVDPGMLGRVFEGMMASDRRGDTGTFFTPPPAVDALVRGALAAHLSARLELPDWIGAEAVLAGDGAVLDDEQRWRVARALRELRVLDPACGSGAFLLGALSRIAPLQCALEARDLSDVKRDVVATALHGIDVQADAALLCALRLWLALTLPAGTGQAVPPLPNLDRRIRQGDALLDPFDLASGGDTGTPEAGAATDSRVRRISTRLAPLGLRYVTSEPGEREPLADELRVLERDLASAWLQSIDHRLSVRLADLRVRATQRDLWGERTSDAIAAETGVPRIEADRAALADAATLVTDTGALPFFSFPVHFADTSLHGFDIVLANPPWVRAHRWPATLRRMVRSRYRVCRETGWRQGAQLAHAPVAAGAQVDLSLLFLEKSVRLLAPNGALGMLLPAKVIRSMYGASARRMLLATTRIASIEDHSLHQHSIFAADAFAAAIVAVRRPGPESSQPSRTESQGSSLNVALHRRRGAPLRFTVQHDDLPLLPGDPASPWLLVPAPVRNVIRRMQKCGPPLGRTLRVRRGVFTGANDVMLIREATPRLGGLVSIRACGWTPGNAQSMRSDEADGASRVRHPSPRGTSGAAPATHAAEPAIAMQVPAADFDAVIEAACLRPVIRGTDVSPWCRRESRWVVWLHGDDGRYRAAPPRTAAYLARHAHRLRARSGTRGDAAAGGIFRVTRESLGHKVIWHDLALTLEAVAVPAVARNPLGLLQPVVPLNTTYFIAAAAEAESLLLAALLNSLPLRVFARAAAERAKDARFRFFAWTIGVLPLPSGWRDHSANRRLITIARDAHADGGLDDPVRDELDGLVGRMYGLGPTGLETLRHFDLWLSGREE